MADHSDEKSPERYAIEQAIARLESDKDRIDAFMTHIRWIVGSAGGLLLVLVAGASFVGISNIGDIEEDLSKRVKSIVGQELIDKEGMVGDIGSLYKTAQAAKGLYDENKKAIESLSILSELEDVNKRDPESAYESLKKLEKEPRTEANRGAALRLLENIIGAGQRGISDSNVLFNSATMASRLGLDWEALKLAVLAEYWHPTVSHKAIRARLAELFGQDFEYRQGSLHKRDLAPKQVRDAAWNTLLDLVAMAPRQEGELTYSHAWNVAYRNRSAGHYGTLIAEIRKSDEVNSGKLISYAYAILAKVIAFRGDAGWEKEYEVAVAEAVTHLEKESPVSTWYEKTINELREQREMLYPSERRQGASEGEGERS